MLATSLAQIFPLPQQIVVMRKSKPAIADNTTLSKWTVRIKTKYMTLVCARLNFISSIM
jgi:hypothetical protein